MPKRKNSLSFAPVPSSHFTDWGQFKTAVNNTQKRCELMPAEGLTFMDVDAKLAGRGDRLTERAFTDLCQLTQTPEGFVRRIAQTNETLALDIVANALSGGMLRGCSLLVDTSSSTVEGVVRDDTHNPPKIAELFDAAMAVAKKTRLTGGWIDGTSCRMTAISGEMTDVKTGKPAKVGDLMGVGFEITSDFGSNGSTSIIDYAERLICLNGMLAKDATHTFARPHTQLEIDDALLQDILTSIERSSRFCVMASAAAQHFLDVNGVRRILDMIATDKHPAASPKLRDYAKQRAREEATRDCRPPGALCLWDFVNGVTDAAKHAKTVQKRRELEHFGYRLMVNVLES